MQSVTSSERSSSSDSDSSEKDDQESSESEQSEPEEEKKESKIVFMTANSVAKTKHAFPNPFVPKSGTSAVFSTGKSLWDNPFGAPKPLVENKTTELPPWLRSACGSDASLKSVENAEEDDKQKKSSEAKTTVIVNETNKKF